MLTGQTLENKANSWMSKYSDEWKFSPNNDEISYIIENVTRKTVLQASNDDKVKEEKHLSIYESKAAQQLWRKGKADNKGFFTLTNCGSNKILTATSNDGLKVFHNCQQVIFDQLGSKVKKHTSMKNTIEISVPILQDDPENQNFASFEEPVIIQMNTSKDKPTFSIS